MANPLNFTVATTTVTLDHSIKATGFELIQASATAASAIISDAAGAVLITVRCPATIGAYFPAPLTAPKILPKTAALTVTVAGAGATFNVHY